MLDSSLHRLHRFTSLTCQVLNIIQQYSLDQHPYKSQQQQTYCENYTYQNTTGEQGKTFDDRYYHDTSFVDYLH